VAQAVDLVADHHRVARTPGGVAAALAAVLVGALTAGGLPAPLPGAEQRTEHRCGRRRGLDRRPPPAEEGHGGVDCYAAGIRRPACSRFAMVPFPRRTGR